MKKRLGLKSSPQLILCYVLLIALFLSSFGCAYLARQDLRTKKQKEADLQKQEELHRTNVIDSKYFNYAKNVIKKLSDTDGLSSNVNDIIDITIIDLTGTSTILISVNYKSTSNHYFRATDFASSLIYNTSSQVYTDEINRYNILYNRQPTRYTYTSSDVSIIIEEAFND